MNGSQLHQPPTYPLHTSGPPVGSGQTQPAPPPAASRPAYQGQDMAGWLVSQRNAGVTPDIIADNLLVRGYSADVAAQLSIRSLRSTDRQTLLYAALTTSAGLSCLALATAAHQLIAGNPDPVGLATMLSMLIVCVPIAVTCGFLADRAERTSAFVMWSSARRSWYGALAGFAAVVGLGRLFAYLFEMISTLTGASQEQFSVESMAQVLVSLLVAIPLFGWSFLQWRRSNLVMSAR